MAQSTPITEPFAVLDIFATEMARADRLPCGLIRFTLVAEQISCHDGSIERAVVARIVMPAAVMPEARRLSIEAEMQGPELFAGCEGVAH